MEWISIKDKRPTKSGVYIVSTKCCVELAYYSTHTRQWEDDCPASDIVLPVEGITHWMQLPSPPQPLTPAAPDEPSARR